MASWQINVQYSYFKIQLLDTKYTLKVELKY